MNKDTKSLMKEITKQLQESTKDRLLKPLTHKEFKILRGRVEATFKEIRDRVLFTKVKISRKKSKLPDTMVVTITLPTIPITVNWPTPKPNDVKRKKKKCTRTTRKCM